jgi:hypothetical protein
LITALISPSFFFDSLTKSSEEDTPTYYSVIQLQEGQKYSKQLHFKTFVAVAVAVE